MMPHQASTISAVFGGVNSNYFEGNNLATVTPGAVATANIDASGGWMFVCSTTGGQRGVTFIDLIAAVFLVTPGLFPPS